MILVSDQKHRPQDVKNVYWDENKADNVLKDRMLRSTKTCGGSENKNNKQNQGTEEIEPFCTAYCLGEGCVYTN